MGHPVPSLAGLWWPPLVPNGPGPSGPPWDLMGQALNGCPVAPKGALVDLLTETR